MKKTLILLTSGLILLGNVHSSNGENVNVSEKTALVSTSIVKTGEKEKALRKKGKALKKRNKDLKDRKRMLKKEEYLVEKERKLNKKEKRINKKENRLHK